MYKENPARVYFDQDHVLTDFLEKQTNEGKYEKKIQKEKENTIKEEEKYIPLFLRNWLPNNLPVFQRVICFFFNGEMIVFLENGFHRKSWIS